MRDKEKNPQKKIKVPDLKPQKDAKGGRKAGGEQEGPSIGPKIPPGPNV
jgi:hypothetical protein